MERLRGKEKEAILCIRSYKMHKGRIPSMRELMQELQYKSPRSASLIMESLIKKGMLIRSEEEGLIFNDVKENDYTRASTILIPLVGTISCGTPILAEENIETQIRVSTKLAKSKGKHFLLRAQGDSMDKAGIKDGDIVLIKEQNTAENGQIVVALIDDEATLKEFHRAGNAIILKPKSTNPSHKPLILHQEFRIQGIVVATIASSKI